MGVKLAAMLFQSLTRDAWRSDQARRLSSTGCSFNPFTGMLRRLRHSLCGIKPRTHLFQPLHRDAVQSDVGRASASGKVHVVSIPQSGYLAI